VSDASAASAPPPPEGPRRSPSGQPRLSREEYVEQAYFFRRLLERIPANEPIQELMDSIKHEVLATTKLPLAIDFMLSELKHSGGFSRAMLRLTHYFTAFQSFLVTEAEDDRGRFDMRIAFAILCKEADYRSEQATPQGEFLFQFETLCRNRLNYDRGLAAMAQDPIYDPAWQDWILTVRRQIGLVELADLIFVRSAYYQPRRPDLVTDDPNFRRVLFGEKEGRIAQANRGKDPLLLFASLQRHLGYPGVPRPQPVDERIDLVPQLARRLERVEARLKLLEEEQKGGIDLTKFFAGKMPQPLPGEDVGRRGERDR
jgi:hypothetical protein